LLSLVNFHKTQASGQKNQILIPDWTYFHCPGTTLVGEWLENQNFHQQKMLFMVVKLVLLMRRELQQPQQNGSAEHPSDREDK